MSTQRSFWTKNFTLLFGSNALLFMVYNMQVPVLPLFGKFLGLSASQIGLFVGTIMFAAMVVRLFSGKLLTIFSKKTLLLVGVLLYLFTSIGYPLLTPFAFLIALRILNGVGHGLGTTYFATAAADELPMNRLGEGMGYFGVSSMLTASLAPLIALPIAQHLGYNAFFITCIIILAFPVLMLFFMTPKPVATTNTATSLRSSFDIAFLPQCLLVFCLGVIMNGVAAYTTLFAQQRHVTTIAWFFFAAAVVGVLMRPFVGNLFDQRGPFIIMIPSVVCLIVGLLLIINVHTGWQLILAGVFYGAADGAIFPTAQSWVLKRAGMAKRESATGMFLNSYDFGMGAGAFVLGKVIDLSSYTAMFWGLLGFTGLYLLLTLYFAYRKV
ncbi:MFS transporter [Secundilactobacillus similis DSM 23365 = JCM 2765]|uniref:Major facilitator superfamily protein n=1 Tax=Secundilactobacillus similis DSM 23365 = JCM 2765 TaxID=1423804 RepID=A0A0R2FAP7_9LACO|nr:MFS transporter [Secundilactobacillus similis]KRN25427.1 major facilitator superfamily protein [Secundilactobacillus similis DSM 23365 = JCM 2765]